MSAPVPGIALNCSILVNGNSIDPCNNTQFCAYSGDVISFQSDLVFVNSDGCDKSITLTITDEKTGEDIVVIPIDPITINNVSPSLSYDFVVPLESIYNFSITAEMTCGLDPTISSTCSKEVSACLNFKSLKTKCHSYRLTDINPGIPRTISANVRSQVGDYTRDYSFVSYIDIDLPGDDVYIVTFTDPITLGTFSFPIYEFCDLQWCTKHMILDLFCHDCGIYCDDCNDHCGGEKHEHPERSYNDEHDRYRSHHRHHRNHRCNHECDDKKHKQAELDRQELNKLTALLAMLFSSIFKEQTKYFGIYSIDSCRNDNIQDINNIFKEINKISARCGQCRDPFTPVVPCTNC